MLTALLLLFAPSPTWKRLASANRSPWLVLFLSFFPLLVICCGVEGWALAKFGTQESSMQRHQNISSELATRYATTQVVLGLLSAGISSVVVFKIATGVNIRTTLRQCASLTIYTLGPAYLMRLVDTWDLLNTWVVCAAAVVLIFTVLYTGVVQMIKPDPAKAFGLYMAGTVILSTCHVVSHLFSVLVLNEKLFKEGLGINLFGF